MLVQQLDQERILFEAVLRQMAMGVAIFEAPSGKMLLANKALQDIFKNKLPKSATVASFNKINAIFTAEVSRGELPWPMARSLHRESIVPYEEIVLPWSKFDRPTIQISSSPIYNAKKEMVAVVALFQDITERKRIKEQLVDVSGREQRRIAHDLHDGLGQELAAIVYRTKALKAHLIRANGAQAGEAGKIGALAEAALARTRDLVKIIQPVAIDSRGLMQSLKDLAQSYARLYCVDCTFTCPRPVRISNPDVALHVFRIAQEAVHNAMKHGKPDRITIGLSVRHKVVELIVSNNGSDFRPSPLKRSKGLGLHIMDYRASVLQGELRVSKHHPKGTMVKCKFRLDAAL